MSSVDKPVAAAQVPGLSGQTNYPEPFATMMRGRTKRKLGDEFGLANFGVNLTSLEPGSMSALSHEHSKQDEFVYVISGSATLRYGDREYVMTSGDCVGFKAGSGVAHQLVNRSDGVVTYLEIGDRSAGDTVTYPDDDVQADLDNNGHWVFRHKNGERY